MAPEDAAKAFGSLGQARSLVRSREPERYRKDVPKAEVYVLDAGHFALDTKADEIAALVREFTTKEVPKTNENPTKKGDRT
jgi:hypothetical protein